jgi:serine/threonine-protein kinase
MYPQSLAIDPTGTVYDVETDYADDFGQVRVIVPSGAAQAWSCNGVNVAPGDISTVLPAGSAWGVPQAVAVSPDGAWLAVADNSGDITLMSLATGASSLLAGTGTPGASGDGGPANLAQLSDYLPSLAFWSSNGTLVLYVADNDNSCIRAINCLSYNSATLPGNIVLAANAITTVAGTLGTENQDLNGDQAVATLATLNSPTALTVDAQGNLYFSDSVGNAADLDYCNVVRCVTFSPGTLSTILSGVGSEGPLRTQLLPAGTDITSLAFDQNGNLLMADYADAQVLDYPLPSGTAAIAVAGVGPEGGIFADGIPATEAQLSEPVSVAAFGTSILFADHADCVLRQVSLTPGCAWGQTTICP